MKDCSCYIVDLLPLFGLCSYFFPSFIYYSSILSTKLILPFMRNLSFVWESVLIFNFLLADRT